MRSLSALVIALLAHFVVNAQTCSYQYRLPITITNNGNSALTNYQVSVTVNTAALVTAGKMQSSGSDIWFNDASGDTLNYWIESGFNTSSTVFWVKVNTIAKTGATIYLHYGQALTKSYNNGDLTFLFFDDFTGTTLNTTKWSAATLGSGTVAVSGGNVTFINSASILAQSGFAGPVISEANVTAVGGSAPAPSLFQFNNGSYNNGVGLGVGFDFSSFSYQVELANTQSGCASYIINNSYTTSGNTNYAGTWSVLRNGTTGSVTWPGGALSSTHAQNGNGNMQTGLGLLCGSNGTMSVAWVRVRQYYAAGTTQTPGTEQVVSIVSSLATTNQSVTVNQSSNTVYGSCNDLIALVNTNAGSAGGLTTAKVWIDGTQQPLWVKRHYEIEPTINGSATVTLYFTQADFNAFNAVNTIKLPTGPGDATGIGHLLIEKRAGTSSDGSGALNSYTGSVLTIQPTAANIVWNAGQSRWEVTFNVTSFSGFFVKTTVSTLPLTLLNFSGSKNSDATVTLQWQTANESDLRTYEVQRGTTTGVFTAIGNVLPDNSAGPNIYTFTDNTPWTGTQRFYRLATLNDDGVVSYSTVVAIGNNGSTSLTVYPNPAHDMVTIVANDAGVLHTTALLMDATGRTIRKLQLDNTYSQVNISGLNPGVYILTFANGSTVKIFKD